MDLLKDIRRELRGGTARTGEDESPRTDESRVDPDLRKASTDAAAGGGEATAAGDAASGESDRDDDHVCSFCETEFDAGRGVCPECDAEIVLRGAR